MSVTRLGSCVGVHCLYFLMAWWYFYHSTRMFFFHVSDSYITAFSRCFAFFVSSLFTLTIDFFSNKEKKTFRVSHSSVKTLSSPWKLSFLHSILLTSESGWFSTWIDFPTCLFNLAVDWVLTTFEYKGNLLKGNFSFRNYCEQETFPELLGSLERHRLIFSFTQLSVRLQKAI